MNITKKNLHKKLQLSILGMSSAFLIGCFPLSASADDSIIAKGECGPNLTYTIDSDYTLRITGTGEMDDFYDVYNIPEEDADPEDYAGATLNTPWYVYNDSIKKIIITDDVTSIGTSAFSRMKSLESVELPDSIETIGDYAFEFYRPTEFTFPKNLQVIGYYAFYFGNLNSIDLPEGLLCIDRGAFYGCKNITSVVFPESLQQVGDFAFSYCDNLTDAYINDGLSSLPENLFAIDYSCDYLPYCNKDLRISLPCTLMRNSGYEEEEAFLEKYYIKNKDNVTIRHQTGSNNKFHWSNSGLTCDYGDYCKVSKTHNSMTPCEIKKTVTRKATDKKSGKITCTATCGALSETKKFTLPAIDKFKLTQTKYTLKKDQLTIYPKFKLTDKKGNEIYSGCYSVKIDNTDHLGTATMRLKLKDCYTGSYTAKYRIVPRSTTIHGNENIDSKLYLFWDNKNHPGATGYEVQISTQKNFKDASLIQSKDIKINKSKCIFYNLPAGTYHARIRVYGLDKDNKRVYSAWKYRYSNKVTQ